MSISVNASASLFATDIWEPGLGLSAPPAQTAGSVRISQTASEHFPQGAGQLCFDPSRRADGGPDPYGEIPRRRGGMVRVGKRDAAGFAVAAFAVGFQAGVVRTEALRPLIARASVIRG